MKIKIIKTAQGRMDRNEEEMYPTTGRPSKVKSNVKSHYEIRLGSVLLHRYESLNNAMVDFETIVNNQFENDICYLLEITEKVLIGEHGRYKR